MPARGVALLLLVKKRIENIVHNSATIHSRDIDRTGGVVSWLGKTVPDVDSDSARLLDRNNRTIEAYDRNIDVYLAKTPAVVEPDPAQHSPGGWLNVYAESLKLRAAQNGRTPRVLDLASGPRPRDGRVYRDHGFEVTLSDASPRSVEMLRESGFDAREINMITDDFGGPWDGISINGGVPHLSDGQLDEVVEKAAASLADGGILAYNFKLADDSTEFVVHNAIVNKGAAKDYYLRSGDALAPWELRHGLFPLMAPVVYPSGGTHMWASKILVKLQPQ
ncbi:methyltransferase domain-containing protein [Nocardia carnea]|uniref:methyltransferase domain-containing protein n=1 Tax=Nocardia carnea TaxID=37328 RepID=UPI002453EBC8|nr:methyltransferase domain-containing protein [Nocardia carnea]